MSLYKDGIILYEENPKDSTQKLLELINEFSKVAGYKINVQKSVAFLYNNNEISERECKQTIPFKITSREFPGGLVVRTQHFQCCGLGSTPGGGTEIPQAAQCSQINK